MLLQDAKNNFYFCCPHIWTSNPDNAFDFETSENFFQFMDAIELDDVQLVVTFDNPQRREVIPWGVPRTSYRPLSYSTA
jgi:hypothetical protein